MINFKNWIDRINNELNLSKFYQKELVNMSFTRSELIELKMIISSFEDKLKEESNEQ